MKPLSVTLTWDEIRTLAEGLVFEHYAADYWNEPEIDVILKKMGYEGGLGSDTFFRMKERHNVET